MPTVWHLNQNYPNPFNPTTVISYQLPVTSDVRLAVYDLLGREVRVLVDAKMEAGIHEVTLEGSGLSGGVYFYRLQACGVASPPSARNEMGWQGGSPQDSNVGRGEFTQTRRLILLR